MSLHDFGSVRVQETSGYLEVTFPFGDAATKAVTKRYRGRWNADRRLWSIDLGAARTDAATVVEAIRMALVAQAPEGWTKALPALSKAAVTTKRFGISLGEGGARILVPPGHKIEYTLKAKKDEGVSRDGSEWIIPSAFCVDKSIRDILRDVLTDDRAALEKMVGYMAGFTLSGFVALLEGEATSLGLTVGANVFANPSFVQKADSTLPREHLLEHPFVVRALETRPDGADATLAFLTGEAAWTALRTRYAQPRDSRTGSLDTAHAHGKWVRRRAA